MTDKEIFGEPSALRRHGRLEAWRHITSNGTLSAAVMVAAALVAVVVANSPAREPVHHVLVAPVGLVLGPWAPSLTVEQLVNDLLMAIFFLLVGIELKCEMCAGELRRPRQAALPMLAAVGGVAVPSLIYLLVNVRAGEPGGWAVPMATDIAFALGVMSLLGDRVASATKVFFSTLAIADDILAIVVIALFYGQTPDPAWVAASVGCSCVLALLNRARVFGLAPYLVVGLALWGCMLNSGIHATLAGVVLALALPAGSEIRLGRVPTWLGRRARGLADAYDAEAHILQQQAFADGACEAVRVLRRSVPPLVRVQRAITVPVNFVILPVFAFVNAQVCLAGASVADIVSNPVAQGVFLGAFLGKPIGIIGVTFVLVRCGFARLPHGVDWPQIVGVGLLGGLGFTMSILITGLAFTDASQVLAAKCAILAGSAASALVGCLYLLVVTRGRA